MKYVVIIMPARSIFIIIFQPRSIICINLSSNFYKLIIIYSYKKKKYIQHDEYITDTLSY